MRAVIVGGSMGGLLVGNMLIRSGWDVDVYERTKSGLEARGAGIAPQEALLCALDRAGVKVEANFGIRVSKRVAYDTSGINICTHYHDQYTTSWSLIYHHLLQAFPPDRYHLGKNVLTVTQAPGSASITLEDGTCVSADLVIGADGMRSTVRRHIFPEIEPRYAGYVAWRGMLDENCLEDAFIDKYFSGFSFTFPAGEEIICYPVAGATGSVRPGERRFNLMWYRPVSAGEDLESLFTGVDGVHYENGIPPHLIRPELIDQMQADAARLLPPDFAGAIAKMQGMFVQAIYDLESDRMARGRVALIGDAAFVARPHCGAGVSKAASDAVVLTTALAKGPAAQALASFSAERTMAGKAAVLWASHLGSYFQMDKNGRHRPDFDVADPPISPEYIIKNTGIELRDAFQA